MDHDVSDSLNNEFDAHKFLAKRKWKKFDEESSTYVDDKTLESKQMLLQKRLLDKLMLKKLSQLRLIMLISQRRMKLKRKQVQIKRKNLLLKRK